MVCRCSIIFIIDGNFTLEFQKVGFFFVNINQFYGGLSFIFFIFSEKYHLKHRKMLFTNNNNTAIKKALFDKVFVRMFFRFRIMRYGIGYAIPHFLSRE